MQDGVNPGSGCVALVLLHRFLGGVRSTRQGQIDGLEVIVLHGTGVIQRLSDFEVVSGRQSMISVCVIPPK
jgi:hypothetical protein